MQFEQFGKYLLLHKIATGGMAEIHLAKQIGLAGFEKLIVIKRIKPELIRDEKFLSMFLDEARLAASMSHPNVVQVFDLDQVDKSIYIAMEYLAGPDFAAVLRTCKRNSRPIPFPLVARLLIGACDGLHYAHTFKDAQGRPLNVVHRDVSPGNLLVTYDGTPKVLDFGVAKSAAQLAETEVGTLKGKLRYISPEMIHKTTVDARADVWALGVVLWEALALRRLFGASNELALIKAIVDGPLPLPNERNPHVPMELVAITMRALVRDRDKRYPSALAMRNDLETYLRKQPALATSVELSAFIKDVFAEEYAAHQKLLAEVPHATPEELESLVRFKDSGSYPSFSGVSEVRTYGDGTRVKKPSRPKIAAAFIAATLAVVSLGWVVKSQLVDSDARSTDTSEVVVQPVEWNVVPDDPAQTRDAATAPAEIKVSVVSVPPGARVLAPDSGEDFGVTPLTKMLRSATGTLILRLEREGYEPAERRVSLAADLALEVALMPIKRTPPRDKKPKPSKTNQELTTDGVLDPFAQ